MRLLVCAASACLILAVHAIYRDRISPAFGSSVYPYVSPDALTVAMHGGIAWLPSLWLPLSLRRPSQVVYWLHYPLLYVPAVLFPAFLGVLSAQESLWLASLVLVLYASLGMIHSLPLVRMPTLRVPRFWFEATVLLVAAVAIGGVLLRFGVPTLTFSLEDVYELRARNERSGGRWLGYFTSWTGNVVFPALIALGLARRRHLLTIAGIAAQLVLFAATGYKLILFSSALLVALAVAVRRGRERFAVWTLGGVLGAIAVALLVDSFYEIPWGSSLLVRRVLVVPGVLTAYYLDFFRDGPFLYLSDNALSSFLHYPYRDTVPAMISHLYVRSPEGSANANYWASAFAHFGVFGMVVFTAALAVLLHVFDSIAERKSLLFAALLVGMPAVALTNSSLQTTLLTHGLALAVFVVFLSPVEHGDAEEARESSIARLPPADEALEHPDAPDAGPG